MKRRDFFGAFGALTVGGVVGTVAIPFEKPQHISVSRANGKGFILGVATETVHVGDFVQIQTYGPASI